MEKELTLVFNIESDVNDNAPPLICTFPSKYPAKLFAVTVALP